MSEIAKTIGQRVRNYRIDKGLSQEKLLSYPVATLLISGKWNEGKRTLLLKVSKRLLQL